jgi:outer membrane protein assembly factor BamB
MTKFRSALFLFLLIGTITQAQYIEWRGLNRSGVYPETGLLKEWPAEGPKLLWVSEGMPKGFSSACVTPNGIFTTGITDSMDVVVALDKTGQLKWKTPYGRYWKASFSDSRCTPTYENGKIYVSSGSGDLACLDANTGNIIWQVKASEKFGGTYGEWGISESLLINGDQLYYTPGGPKTTMVALNKNTGETIWTSESLNDNPAYVSPMLINKDGKKLIVGLTELYVFGVNPDNGKILWKENYYNINSAASIKVWEGAPKINTITPLYYNGNLYITKGYNHVGVMFKLSDNGTNVTQVWNDSVLDCHHGGVVLVDGYIYGSNWVDNGNGNWCCIDWNTGKKMYETTWYNKGSIISADGMLYCYDEKKGFVGLVKPNPNKFDLMSSFKVPKGSGPHWAHPVISDGVLYIRHGNALMAYDVKKN